MEGEARVECSKIIDIIDRLERCEVVSNEETAQIILHIEQCAECESYLHRVFNRITEYKVE